MEAAPRPVARAQTNLRKYRKLFLMKQSDSTNSLTELNKDDPICFICLEIHSPELPLVDSQLLRSCGCKFSVHAPCWNKWIEQGKSDYDCPMCGRRSLHLGLVLSAPFQTRPIPEAVLPFTEQSICNKKCLYISFAITIIIFIVLILLMIGVL